MDAVGDQGGVDVHYLVLEAREQQEQVLRVQRPVCLGEALHSS